MDTSALLSIKKFLSEPVLIDFLSNNFPEHVSYLKLIVEELIKIEIFIKRRSNPGEEEQVLVEDLQITHNFIKDCILDLIDDHNVVSIHWNTFLDFFTGIVVSCNYWKQREEEQRLLQEELVAVINSLNEKHIIQNLLLHTADCNSNFFLTSPNYNEEEEKRAQALLLIKTFPALLELKEPYEIFQLLLESTKELDNLPQQICEACHFQGQPLPLLLIGSLLSLKQCDHNIWNQVKDDLVKIKESNNAATNKYMKRIFTYCYNDLPPFLKRCFLYLACYPIDYEIPAMSLTQLWIAEEFVAPQEGETIEDTANTYLEQLVQRSLVCVSKRSFLGTIKYCRVPRSIHEFAIQRSNFNNFLVINPSPWSKPGQRLAVHNDYMESNCFEGCDDLQSILAFGFGGSIPSFLGKPLKVIELRKCAYKNSKLLLTIYDLRYMGLKGSNIYELREEIGYIMKNLKTLDVRDTKIETLPESLWNISELRYVYVNSDPKIKGPPSIAKISDLHILKTVGIPESWRETFPQCLINLRKLALSNRDNSYWKSISNLLSHMVNLLSMTTVGNIVPSEFVDLRAFPNLETVN